MRSFIDQWSPAGNRFLVTCAAVAVGMVCGVGMAVALGRLLSAQLYGVSALDPFVFVIAVATSSATALLASWLPARRAARTDPILALRAE